MAPADGCYLHGLYLEGAAWDDATGFLKESAPKIIHVQIPIMHFVPKYLLATEVVPEQSFASAESSQTTPDVSVIKAPEKFVYECPTYKTSERAG